jgi:EAL domain-containing protein (putative c-di-GMP-specific phosphodiesterase class I)
MAEQTLRAFWSGSFHLLGVEVKCHTLSDGRRIIDTESFHNLMEAMGTPGVTIDEDAMQEFARWQKGMRN